MTTPPTGQPAITGANTQANGSGIPELQRTPAERNTEWSVWWHDLLINRGFAHQDALDPNLMHYSIRTLERAIARKLPPDQHVPYATVSNVMRLKVLPTHETARGLAAALGVPELAILLMSGQLDKAAIAPLIGSEPPILRTAEEYAAVLDRLEREMPDPAFRAVLMEFAHREWRYTEWLRSQLDTFGFTEDEWLAMRDFLNSPSGRSALRRALTHEDGGMSGGADDDDEPYLPDEFRQAEERDTED